VNQASLTIGVPDLVDVWFDSGASVAQWHNFRNKELVDNGAAFPQILF